MDWTGDAGGGGGDILPTQLAAQTERQADGTAPRDAGDILPTLLAAHLDGSFERLVLTYQDRLYAFALRLTGSSRDAEEIVQDAFVRAYRALRAYPAERVRALALRPWLYRVTLNVFRNTRRGRRPPHVSLDQSGNGLADALSQQAFAEPESLAERAEAQSELAAAVAALPERYREAVVLRHVEGLSYAEAAAILGQPVGTTKANVHRGVALLRAALSTQRPAAAAVEVRR